MYAKLINGVLVEAPKILKHNGLIYHNPQGEVCIENGYLPVVESPYPEVDENNFVSYEPHYEQIENEIIQTWVEAVIEVVTTEVIEKEEQSETVPAPEDEVKQLIIEKIRAVYSIDDEIAILRQRDSKPEEFQEYYNFAEQCKAEAKTMVEELAKQEVIEEEPQEAVENNSEL